MTKRIVVYGSYVAKKPVFQRYWKRRVDGIKQRYWKKTTRYKKVVVSSGRYEFYGKGRDLYGAIWLAHQIMPNGYVVVSAAEFLAHPEKYGTGGFWIDKEVESL